MIDVASLKAHAKENGYGKSVDDLIRLSKEVEENKHIVDYKLMTFSDGPAVEMECRTCGAWIVLTNPQNANFSNHMTKGALRIVCKNATVN